RPSHLRLVNHHGMEYMVTSSIPLSDSLLLLFALRVSVLFVCGYVNSSITIFDLWIISFFFFFQAEDGIRDWSVTGVQTCALPIFAISVISNVEALFRVLRRRPDVCGRFALA